MAGEVGLDFVGPERERWYTPPMPKKSSKRKASKKAAKKKAARRKTVSRRKRAVPRVRLTRTKIPGGGAAAQIHQGLGAAHAAEIVPQGNGDASK